MVQLVDDAVSRHLPPQRDSHRNALWHARRGSELNPERAEGCGGTQARIPRVQSYPPGQKLERGPATATNVAGRRDIRAAGCDGGASSSRVLLLREGLPAERVEHAGVAVGEASDLAGSMIGVEHGWMGEDGGVGKRGGREGDAAAARREVEEEGRSRAVMGVGGEARFLVAASSLARSLHYS